MYRDSLGVEPRMLRLSLQKLEMWGEEQEQDEGQDEERDEEQEQGQDEWQGQEQGQDEVPVPEYWEAVPEYWEAVPEYWEAVPELLVASHHPLLELKSHLAFVEELKYSLMAHKPLVQFLNLVVEPSHICTKGYMFPRGSPSVV